MRRSLLRVFAGTIAGCLCFLLFSWNENRGLAPHPVAALAQEQTGDVTPVSKLLSQAVIGEAPPARCVMDPYPEFNGVAVDPTNNLVVFSAPNIRSLMLYSRTAAATSVGFTPPLGQIVGPATHMSGMSGVAVDPIRKEFYGIETDVGDTLAAFSYKDRGDATARVLAIPIGGYGVSLNQARKEIAISIEDNDQIMVFRLGAQGVEPPRRQIRGLHTTLADPKGLSWDAKNHEIVAANEGNWSRSYWDSDYKGGGQYRPPSIVVFAETAHGDARPLRVIQGDQTMLDAPAGLAVDSVHGEIAVANDGGNSVLIFDRRANGNVAPIRVIHGEHTHISYPVGMAIDTVHDELWVANWGHTAEVFERTASGDAAPKRLIRSAPPGTPVAGMAVMPALAFDSKRDQLLVPN